MTSNAEDYFSYIREEIVPLYQKVKKTIIEAENFDPLRETYIAPLNEIRNTFDHIMKSASDDENEDLMENLKEAKVHLNRAGYDVFEILSSNLGIAIGKAIEKYDSEIIARVFPQYYENIQPKIIEIQQELVRVRSKKNVDDNGNPENFSIYEAQKDELIQAYSKIQAYIPQLEREKKKGLRRFLFEHALTIIISVLTGIAVTYFAFKFDW